VSGAPQTAQPGGGGAAPGNQQKQLNTGSGFQNLDNYLNANKEQNFGGQVLGKVQGEVQGARNDMQAGADSFRNTVTQQNQTPTGEQISGAIANPGQADAKAFQGWQNQQYQGARDLSGNQAANNQYWNGTSKADTSTRLLGSEPGRFSLLDSYYGKPSYNFGEKSLDNLLLQTPTLGRQTNQLKTQVAGLKQEGKTGADALSSFAGGVSGQVDKSRQATRSAIGLDDQGQVIRGQGAGALGSVQDQIEADYKVKLGQGKALGSAFDADSPEKAFTQDQLSGLGLSAEDRLYNLKLRDYYDPAEITRDQAANPEQRTRLNALSQLAGIDQNFIGKDQPELGSKFNLEKFKKDQAAQEKAYGESGAPIRTKVDEYQKYIDELKELQGGGGASFTNIAVPGQGAVGKTIEHIEASKNDKRTLEEKIGLLNNLFSPPDKRSNGIPYSTNDDLIRQATPVYNERKANYEKQLQQLADKMGFNKKLGVKA
jgi:hypothetical protein